MSTTVSYKGQNIATVSNNTKTLETEGKYLEADIILTDSSQAAPVIDPLTVTPTTSEQTFNSSSVDGYKPVVVNAMPSGTAGTPTATKGAVSNHSVSVTPAVTNTTGYISGGTKTGTAVTVSASELVSGTKSISANGTGIDVTNYASVDVAVPSSAPSLQTKSVTYTPSTSQQTDSITADSGYDGLDEVDITVNAMPSGVATAPTTISGSQATLSTGTNTITLQKTLSVTPRVTTAGYVSAGTAGNALVSLNANVTTKAASTYYPSTSDQTIASGTYLTGAQTIEAVTYSNTLIASNIKKDVVVTIGDSADADRILTVTGTYEGGGGGTVQYDTKTVTASNYPTSLSFTGMQGEPKAFVVRLNAQVSSSGSTTYYYIVDISHFGTTTHGNCFRIGSTRRVDNITSGYSYTYSGTTLTITSSASSRSASPGAFYSGSYELLYAY